MTILHQLCYRCGEQIDHDDCATIVVLRRFALRTFDQYDYCSDCLESIAAAMGLSQPETEALRLRGVPGDITAARGVAPLESGEDLPETRIHRARGEQP